MKKFLAFFVLLLFSTSAFANDNYTQRYNGYPQGTFKKSKSGKIIQYDKNGKKVGVYNINSRKYRK